MKLGPFLVSIVVFVFIAFLFPTLYDACRNVNATLTTAPVIQVFPWVLLAVAVLPSIYFGIKQGD